MSQAGEGIRARVDAGASRAALQAAGALLFVLLTGIGANVQVPVPPLGVPLTLQTLMVVLAALCLGPRVGAASMAAYVLAGAIGAPLFADWSSGWGVLMGQTGGYLLGFIVCQPVVTWFVRARDGSVRGWLGLVLGVVVGHLVIFALGVPWLYVVRASMEPITPWEALYGGMIVFLPTMVVKCVLAVLIGRIAAPWASRRIW